MIEAFTEHLVTGTSDWPECRDDGLTQCGPPYEWPEAMRKAAPTEGEARHSACWAFMAPSESLYRVHAEQILRTFAEPWHAQALGDRALVALPDVSMEADASQVKWAFVEQLVTVGFFTVVESETALRVVVATSSATWGCVLHALLGVDEETSDQVLRRVLGEGEGPVTRDALTARLPDCLQDRIARVTGFRKEVVRRMLAEGLLEAAPGGEAFQAPAAVLEAVWGVTLLGLFAEGETVSDTVLRDHLSAVVAREPVPTSALVGIEAWYRRLLYALERGHKVERAEREEGVPVDAVSDTVLYRRVCWWRRGGGSAAEGPVNLAALGPKPPSEDGVPEERGGAARRRRIRCRVACAVCARLDWDTTRRYVHFWKQPEEAREQSIIGDGLARGRATPSFVDDAAGGSCAETQADPSGATPREMAWQLFDPERYHRRWCFRRTAPGFEGALGGIPLEELRASAVRDPGVDGQLWLLHRKVFKMVICDGVEVADPAQKVPVCSDCHGSLHRRRPQMPKVADANDLWMGKLPRQLTGLSEGAWLLLPLVRPLIRRFSCMPDGATWCRPDERIKAFVGNVAAYPQKDGGRLLQSLPPKPEDLVERVVLAFVGSEADLQKAYVKDLEVSVGSFKEAYDFLRGHNALYERVIWDEDAAQLLFKKDSCLGLSSLFEGCVRLQEPGPNVAQVRQVGAPDAVVDGLEAGGDGDDEDAEGPGEGVPDAAPAEGDEAKEEWEYVAGVADADMQLDCDRQLQHIEVGLRRQALLAQQTHDHEQRVRASDPDALAGYKCRPGRARVARCRRTVQGALRSLSAKQLKQS